MILVRECSNHDIMIRVLKHGDCGLVSSTLLPWMEKKYDDFQYKIILSFWEKKIISLYSQGVKYNLLNRFQEYVFLPNFSKFDIFHVDAPRYSCVWTYLLKKKNRKIKTISHFHGSQLRSPSIFSFFIIKHILPKMSDVFLYSTPDLFIFLSGLSERSRRIENIPKIWLPNPIDTSKFRPMPEIEKTEDEILVFTRISPEKGVNKILKFIENHKDKTFILIELGDKNYIEKVRKEIKKRNLTNIRWEKPVRKSELPYFLNKFKYVLPQFHAAVEMLGCYGISELEAASCGCKIIGMDWLNREFVERYHSIEKVARRLYQIYYSLLSEDIDSLLKLQEESRPYWRKWRLKNSNLHS